MLRTTFLILLALVFSLSTFSQESAQFESGQMLVKPKDRKDIYVVTKTLPVPGIRVEKLVSDPVNIWLLSFDDSRISNEQALEIVRTNPFIMVAQNNHKVTMRSTTPNDPNFNSQWQYINTGQSGGTPGADIDADLAWDITTGGFTAAGDQIVAAILDDGIGLTHNDFGANLWTNTAEIANNGIDDDGNGYVDDERGWSTVTNNDNVSGGSHGTPVAGIVGARGNNNTGVAGVNWNVKLMIVKNNFNTNEAAVLAAYSYPLQMRKIYNQTNGQAGAYVVVTNASWGLDYGQPANAPLWCAFYDTMGVHGILSCGATINSNVNVDVQGDLPTACPSNYLITVTNMNHNDVKVTSAGYGATTIDLGAHGSGTFTTSNTNTYGTFGGTSGATPHVTGAVALLYSAPCPAFAQAARTNPAATALLVKQFILNGTDPKSSLQGITVTGGRLNLNNSLNLLMNHFGCSGMQVCQSPAAPAVSVNSATSAVVSWGPVSGAVGYLLRYRPTGGTWTSLGVAAPGYTISGLTECTEYEVEIASICQPDTSGWSNTTPFSTIGCPACTGGSYCTISGNTQDEWIQSVVLGSINNVSGNNNGYGNFTNLSTPLIKGNSYSITITPGYSGTVYQERIYVYIDYNHNGVFTDPGELVLFTSGITSAYTANFSVPLGAATGPSRLRVILSYNTMTSSCGTIQYGEAEDYCLDIQSFCPEVTGLNTNRITPTSARLNWTPVSTGVNSYQVRTRPVGGNWVFINIPNPSTAFLDLSGLTAGVTYEWQIVAWCNAQGTTTGPWSVVNSFTTGCQTPATLNTGPIQAKAARLNWQPVFGAVGYVIQGSVAGSSNTVSIQVLAPAVFKDVYGLQPNTTYQWRIRTWCDMQGVNKSDWSAYTYFTTNPGNRLPENTPPFAEEPLSYEVKIAPNPAGGESWIYLSRFSGNNEQITISLIDLAGRELSQTKTILEEENRPVRLDLSNMAPGLYFVRIVSEKTDSVHKLMVY